MVETKAAAREQELVTSLGTAQRARQAIQRSLERAGATAKLADQRLLGIRASARAVLEALPPSAAEEAEEAARLARIAAGEVVAEESDDEIALLGRALDRAMRGSELVRAAEAAAALAQTELQAERAGQAAAKMEQQATREAHELVLEEREALRAELAAAMDAVHTAEEAARRFQVASRRAALLAPDEFLLGKP